MTRALIKRMKLVLETLPVGSDTVYGQAIAAAREYLAATEQGPVAWEISYHSTTGETRRIIHGHNAVGDYRQIDPQAIATPIYTHPAQQPKAESVNQMLLEALKMALHQNEHDMVMTGAECRKCAAAIAQAEQAPQSTELTDDYLDPFVDVVYKHWQDPTTFDHGVIRADFRAAFDSHKFTTPEDMKNQVDMQVEINQQKEHITRLERSYRELRAMLATSQKDVSKLQKQLKETK